MGSAPENTLLSIQKALDFKAKWIEIDVHYVDGHIMVIHDDKVKHPAKGSVKINKQTFDFLRSIDIGEGEKIPILEEVLDTIDKNNTTDNICLNIELKGDNTAEPVCNLIEDYIKFKGWKYENFMLSSFKYRQLTVARKLLPNISLGVLFNNLNVPYFKIAEELSAKFLNVNKRILSLELIRQSHNKGFKILVFTVNKIDEILKIKKMDADGVFTNYPELFLAAPISDKS